MTRFSFRKPFMALAMLAILLAFGFAFVSCDGGGNSGGTQGGGGSLTLRKGQYEGLSPNFVRFSRPAGGFSGGTFSLTINGTNVSYSSATTDGQNRQMINFSDSVFPLTVGTRYTVTVVYSSNPPFTLSETVTCEQN